MRTPATLCLVSGLALVPAAAPAQEVAPAEDAALLMKKALDRLIGNANRTAAEAANSVPRQSLFDNALSVLDSEENADRTNFWKLFALLVSPGSITGEEKGTFRLSSSPTPFFSLSATLSEPVLRDKVKDALDADAEESSLRALDVSDDALFEAKINVAPSSAGDLRRTLADYAVFALEGARDKTQEYLDSCESLLQTDPAGAAYFEAERKSTQASEALRREESTLAGLDRALKALRDSRSGVAGALAAIAAEIDLQQRLLEKARREPATSAEVPEEIEAEIAARAFSRSALEAVAGLPGPQSSIESQRSLQNARVLQARREVEVSGSVTAALWPTFSQAHARVCAQSIADEISNRGLRPLYAAYRNRVEGHVTVRYRHVDPLVGQTERGVSFNLTWGLPRLPRGASAPEDVAAWLRRNPGIRDAQPHSFALQAGWTDKREIALPFLPAASEDAFQEAKASFNWTTKLFRSALPARGEPNGADHGLTLTYTRPNEDFVNPRILVNETLTFHLGDSMSVPISITYSNRQELIDEAEVRGHLGFSYSFEKDLPE